MESMKQGEDQAESMEGRKPLLDKAKMEKGLAALDEAVGKIEMIYAFSPITLISPGGFLAVTHFQNRNLTEDIDVIIDPQYARDKDVSGPLRQAMAQVGADLGFGDKWINDSVDLFITPATRKSLFLDAEKQNIVLWDGEHLRVLAAPLEWGLETKLRRLSTKPGHPKRVTDIDDILVILNTLTDRNKGALKRDLVRGLNRNGFDVSIKDQVLDVIAEAYEGRYGEKPFR
ncbi:hypothetical protein AJ79_02933 [Helicocarpus griseus UAMH5409]|uniref:Uncharacterized protein n=1 Tax=Helicocarpus griseus UAMH5409 TaxID=1447875 RepID=A0A2B7Y1C0_9EURO|nr:hypothetical protein AJ79_02933 [Helicocarpus griseus UAMH5409]